MKIEERKKFVRTYKFTIEEVKEAMFEHMYNKTGRVEDHHRDNSTIVTRSDTIDLIITIDESTTVSKDT